MADVDFIEEIRIAQYWRQQLGEYEYVHYNPDDLRRWFIALETRGHDDIRGYLIERTGRHPAGAITGIVASAPHPPLSIVELWLASREKTSTQPYWTALALFGLVMVFFVGNLQSCASLRSVDRLATHPPPTSAPLQVAGPQAPPPASATLPNSAPQPASTATSSAHSSGSGAPR